MNLRNFLLANTLIEVPFGLVALLAPAQVLFLAGATLGEPEGILYARMFGTAIISMGLLSGLTLAMSPIVPLEVERLITVTLLVFHTLLAAILILGQLIGVRDGWGWSVVGLQLLFAGCFAYFRFSSKIAREEIGI
jgi:hypothetical protein